MFTIRCPSCEYEGPATATYKGSTAIGFALLLLCFVPGLVYGVWQARSRQVACPQCNTDPVEITAGFSTGPALLIASGMVGLVLLMTFLLSA